jgi:hypothetical protein
MLSLSKHAVERDGALRQAQGAFLYLANCNRLGRMMASTDLLVMEEACMLILVEPALARKDAFPGLKPS